MSQHKYKRVGEKINRQTAQESKLSSKRKQRKRNPYNKESPTLTNSLLPGRFNKRRDWMENSHLVRDARMEEEVIDEMENMTEEKGSQLHPHPQTGKTQG